MGAGNRHEVRPAASHQYLPSDDVGQRLSESWDLAETAESTNILTGRNGKRNAESGNMKFGIMNLFPSAGEAEDHQVLHDTLEEIRIADQLGFDSVWLAEHHFSRYGILGNPLQFGAAIAAGTDRIMIGTAVMVVPFHDPIRLAEEGAALDVISKGRFQMGVGRGYQPREFKGFGVDPAESRERYDEAMEIVQRAWTQEGWSFRGRHFSYEDLTTYPRPYQDGGPPPGARSGLAQFVQEEGIGRRQHHHLPELHASGQDEGQFRCLPGLPGGGGP